MKAFKQYFSVIVLLSITVASCGAGTEAPAKPPAPPPPIDQDLRDLLPYETDVVMWLDIKTLRGAAIWQVIEELFRKEQLEIPGKAAINPLFASDEALLGFWESEQHGSQLLIVAKGDASTRRTAVATVLENGDATPISAEGFEGAKAKDFFLLSLTERTFVFGNERIVRMSAKAAKGEGRRLTDNPSYEDFQIHGPAAAQLRYHRDRREPLATSLGKMAPRINPNAISRVDGRAFTDAGMRIEIDVRAETQMDAAVIAQDLNQTKEQLSKNMLVIFFGLEWLLDSVAVQTQKETVQIEVDLDERDITELGRLLDRLQKLREMLGSQGAPTPDRGQEPR